MGFEGVRYSALCPKGSRNKTLIDSHIGRLRRVSFLLIDAETEHPGNVETYRRELVDLKATINQSRGMLAHHVAHCTQGCVRDSFSGLSNSAFTNDSAPAHNKPPLPRMAELAARLRNGEALEAIATEYDRHPQTIGGRLAQAGFSGRDGRPLKGPATPKPVTQQRPRAEEPWRADAVCAQTDPESFFPEKGESNREAKSVCSGCTVAAECLDYAIANDERFGVWGGLSERERRRISKAIRSTHLETKEAS